MSKRFTDTEIWKEQAWFNELPPLYKLAWMYVTDSCDHAGIWKIDVVQLKKDTGIDTFDLRDFIEKCNLDYDRFTGEKITKERVKIVDNKWLWLTGFIQFQYGNKEGVVRENNITKSATDILKSLSIYDEGINKGFLTLEKGSGRVVKGTARDKDKDKDNIDKEVSKKYEVPTVEDVEEYFEEKGEIIKRDIPLEAEKFWNHFEDAEWKNNKGKRIKNWRLQAGTWTANYKKWNEERINKHQQSSSRIPGMRADAIIIDDNVPAHLREN